MLVFWVVKICEIIKVDVNVSKEYNASISRALLASSHDIKSQKTDIDNFTARELHIKIAFMTKLRAD
jgi:hypothetical protein